MDFDDFTDSEGRRFKSIQVPHPSNESLMVWVNVWTNTNKGGRRTEEGVRFCRRVRLSGRKRRADLMSLASEEFAAPPGSSRD